MPIRHAADRAADLKTILKFTLFSLFLGGHDEIETIRNQSLIMICFKLFSACLRTPRAPHKPRSIAEPLVPLQSESVNHITAFLVPRP